MPTYCFILGNNPVLSIAEIFRQEAARQLTFAIRDLTSQSLVVSAPALQVADWQAHLGGTIKIGSVIQEFESFEAVTRFLTPEQLRWSFFPQRDQKIVFGFSLYGNLFRRYDAQLKNLGLYLKKTLRQQGVASRFVVAKDGHLTSVQVTKNKMIERGADIMVVIGLHRCYLARTESVQDFEDFSRRDYDRPARDIISGMLPPKVARMMINLSGLPPTARLHDPFCGSGTVLHEAALLGFTKLGGSDISQRAVDATKKNFDWLKNAYHLDGLTTEITKTDVRTLDTAVAPASLDAIVTEPYLGPPQRSTPSTIEMLALVNELETLYLNAFKNFAKALKANAPVVIIFPLFKTPHGIYSLRILEALDQLGFHRVNPVPEKVSLFAKVGPTARGSLIYRREDQKVEREIFIFRYAPAR